MVSNITGAPIDNKISSWSQIQWEQQEVIVRRLQMRIVKAEQSEMEQSGKPYPGFLQAPLLRKL